MRVDDFTHAGLPREAGAILLIEVDGHPAQVADDAAAENFRQIFETYSPGTMRKVL